MDSIDVFVPLHPKDLAVLPRCLDGLRRHLRPAPARIVVVMEQPDLIPVTQRTRLGIEIMAETDFTELRPRSELPTIVVKGKLRTGWYFQQFLKYGARRFSRTPAYAVMDADTVLIAPLVLWHEGKAVFDRGDQHHRPYFDTFERLLGWRPEPQPSYIVNYLLFEVARLDAMLAEIEQRCGQAWDRAVMANSDLSEMSAFSEYETYGYWLSHRDPGHCLRGDGRNLELRVRKRWFHWWFRHQALRLGCNSISYHNHRR